MDNKFGLDFVERTKYANLSESDIEKGVTAPELDTPVSGAKLIDLPASEGIDIPPNPFRDLMENRRSHRAFSDQPLTVEQISWLLWSAQGVQKTLAPCAWCPQLAPAIPWILFWPSARQRTSSLVWP